MNKIPVLVIDDEPKLVVPAMVTDNSELVKPVLNRLTLVTCFASLALTNPHIASGMTVPQSHPPTARVGTEYGAQLKAKAVAKRYKQAFSRSLDRNLTNINKSK